MHLLLHPYPPLCGMTGLRCVSGSLTSLSSVLTKLQGKGSREMGSNSKCQEALSFCHLDFQADEAGPGECSASELPCPHRSHLRQAEASPQVSPLPLRPLATPIHPLALPPSPQIRLGWALDPCVHLQPYSAPPEPSFIKTDLAPPHPAWALLYPSARLAP